MKVTLRCYIVAVKTWIFLWFRETVRYNQGKRNWKKTQRKKQWFTDVRLGRNCSVVKPTRRFTVVGWRPKSS